MPPTKVDLDGRYALPEEVSSRFILAPTAKRLVGLGQTLQTAGGPPLPEQMSELHQLEKTMNQVGWAESALMMLPKAGNPALTDANLYDVVAYLRTLQEQSLLLGRGKD